MQTSSQFIEVKESHRRMSVGAGADPDYRKSARRWRSHKPGCGLPLLSAAPAVTFRSAELIALWPVPNCTARWQRHMRANHLRRVATWQWNGQESNPRPIDCESDALTTTPRSHGLIIEWKSTKLTILYNCHSPSTSRQLQPLRQRGITVTLIRSHYQSIN